MKKPLEGIRVLDMTKVIAGPLCSMLLSDMGADVIKIEKKDVGEEGRTYGPWKEGVSLFYTVFNRNKRSMGIDFRNDEGLAVFRDLIKVSDVLVENYRPGTLASMGFDADALKKLNPRLIVAHLSGFGQYGPNRDRVAYDAIIQAMCGLEDLTGQVDGMPQMTGSSLLDCITGVYGAYGVMLALFEREKSGLGQEIDVALLDSGFSVLTTNMPDYLANGVIQTRVGNTDRVCAPVNTYMAKDRYIHINGGAQAVFKRLCQCMEREDLMDRFGDPDYRFDHGQEIDEILAEWVADKEAEELERRLTAFDIPASVVRNVGEALDSDHVKARKVVEFVDYPGIGPIPLPGVNVKLSRTPGAIYRRPALAGEHSEEILRDILGKTREEIRQLKASRAV
ncbi:Formyl-CoA transferase [uncultured delta proteobacterium]|uniref:Formyl-CoA transferase n=1 Tax=uncultured delta proteobacterium TaxID=34034 RepID=A0A212KAD7_9DELT|nr:Formyl-CoA transferase [uncultured delta proteobacterium]